MVSERHSQQSLRTTAESAKNNFKNRRQKESWDWRVRCDLALQRTVGYQGVAELDEQSERTTNSRIGSIGHRLFRIFWSEGF